MFLFDSAIVTLPNSHPEYFNSATKIVKIEFRRDKSLKG